MLRLRDTFSHFVSLGSTKIGSDPDLCWQSVPSNINYIKDNKGSLLVVIFVSFKDVFMDYMLFAWQDEGRDGGLPANIYSRTIIWPILASRIGLLSPRHMYYITGLSLLCGFRYLIRF